jgi:antitoxin (DNA-binding transcriptional repressor) of toxin-antitoxin stability system
MRVGIKELKNSLSRYLRMVKAGEVVYVAERTEVVAELRAPRSSRTADDVALAALEEAGLLTRGAGVLEDFEPLRTRRRGKKSLTDIVLETRR